MINRAYRPLSRQATRTQHALCDLERQGLAVIHLLLEHIEHCSRQHNQVNPIHMRGETLLQLTWCSSGKLTWFGSACASHLEHDVEQDL